MKKLFALLMALTMTFQLVTPAWADTAEEHTHENTSTVEETTEAPTEETAVPTEETPAEETTVAAEAEPVDNAELAAAKVRVTFVCTPEDLTLVVYPADGDIDQSVEAEEDGTYLLEPGMYAYLAAAEGYTSTEGRFAVTDGEDQVEVVLVQADTAEEVEALASSATSGYCGDNLRWSLDQNTGTLTITGSGAMNDYTHPNGSENPAPWASYKYNIKKLVLPDEITHIGSYAFYMSGLQSVSFGNASLTLGDYCFAFCQSLTEINFGTGTIIPGECAFGDCDALVSVRIPGNVKMNGQYTGAGSGYWLFYHCDKLQEVTVDCDYIGPFAFESCYSLQDVTFTNKNTQFYFLENDSGHPFNANGSGVMQINVHGYLCSKVSALVEKTQPVAGRNIILTFSRIEGDTTEHTEQIVPAVSATCSSTGRTEGKICSVCGTVLVRQTVVASLKHTLVEVEAKDSTCAEEGCAAHWACTVCGATFSDAEGKTKTNPTIAKKAHTEVIDEAVAPTCTETGLTEGKHCSVCEQILVKQEKVPALGHTMVKTEAVAPTYFAPGNNEYYTCSVCGKVYKDAEGLTETTVADETLPQLASVASGKFGEDDCLSWVLTEDGTLTISGSGEMPDFDGSSERVPWFSKRDSVLSVVVEPGVTSVGSYAFYLCRKMRGVSLPQGLTKIGESTFEECKLLKSVTIPETVTKFWPRAFYNCSSLATVDIRANLAGIPREAFYNCQSLKKIELPESATVIVERAFHGCSELTSVKLSSGTEEIGIGAFEYCSKLESIELPKGLTKLENFVFEHCTGLKHVKLPSTLQEIGMSVFSQCESLEEVNIPDSVVSIGGGAFFFCTSLKEVTIPAGVKMDGSVFYSCTALRKVTLLADVSLDADVFNSCSDITDVFISKDVVIIGNGSFDNCSGLKNVYFSGNAEEWQNMSIGSNNDPLYSAVIHYGATHICTLRLIPSSAPTCTSDGNNAYYLCGIKVRFLPLFISLYIAL